MSKHTPRPWALRRPADGMVGTKKQLVAAVYGNDPDCTPDDRMRANARLIAAAPDLLEQLQLMVQQFEKYVPAAPNGGDEAWRISKARAAIAKATGEAA